MNVEPYIETSSGRLFRLDTPEFHIEDIAHALSMTCRYAGHCSQFYSVAEHSVLVSEIMEQWRLGDPLEGLLHDASEAYICDIPGPWKCRVPDYKVMEAQLETKLQTFFGLPEKTPGCKHSDLTALMVEGAALLKSGGQTMIDGGIPEHFQREADRWLQQRGRSIWCLTPAGAKTSFLHRYEKLMRKRK